MTRERVRRCKLPREDYFECLHHGKEVCRTACIIARMCGWSPRVLILTGRLSLYRLPRLTPFEHRLTELRRVRRRMITATATAGINVCGSPLPVRRCRV